MLVIQKHPHRYRKSLVPMQRILSKSLSANLVKLVHECGWSCGIIVNKVVSIQGFSSLIGLTASVTLMRDAKDLTTSYPGRYQKRRSKPSKKSYDDIGKMAEELSKADVEKYAKRSTFEGLL